MPEIITNGIRIAYQLDGEGHPLVLISGVGYGAWFWHRIVPGLMENYHILTFDNRGAGDSEKPAGPYSVTMMATDTIGILDQLGMYGAYLVGHSLGGYIAQEIVATRPDLVGKLVLSATTHGGKNVIPITPEAYEILTKRDGDPMELIKRGIEVACAPGFSERHPDLVQELINYRFTNPVPTEQYQAQVAAGIGMVSMSDEQVINSLASIRIPVLIVFGEYDKVVPPGNAQLLADKIPDSQIEIIPDTGHMFPIEDPNATVAVLRDFL